jgi:putative transposase
MVVLDIEVFGRRGVNPAVAFLARFAEYHDLSETECLVDGMGYLTAFCSYRSGQSS